MSDFVCILPKSILPLPVIKCRDDGTHSQSLKVIKTLDTQSSIRKEARVWVEWLTGKAGLWSTTDMHRRPEDVSYFTKWIKRAENAHQSLPWKMKRPRWAAGDHPVMHFVFGQRESSCPALWAHPWDFMWPACEPHSGKLEKAMTREKIMVLVAPEGLVAVTPRVSESKWAWHAMAWVVGILRNSVKCHIKQALTLAANHNFNHDSPLWRVAEGGRVFPRLLPIQGE